MSHRFRSGSWFSVCLLMLFAALVWSGCSPTDTGPTSANETQNDTPLLSANNPAVRSVMAVQNRHTPDLMADTDVIGTATTIGDDGNLAIMVLVLNEKAKAKIPAHIDGVATKVLITERIVAMGKPPKTSGHTAKQTPPIQLGTSGGWRYDLANGYCCSGTIGSLIQVGSQKRILSNYHVLEGDIVAGGNGRAAATGDYIIQPGLIDINCAATSAQNVATLVKTSSLPGSNVDCSSATIITGMVDPLGSILEIGTISSSTVAAYVGQNVKKSGRTTGLTRSYINGLNGTVNVSYETECAGDLAFTKTFTGQLLVYQKRSSFLASGDSGSLMVEDVTTNARAIGLLYAGSNSLAVANPIDEVLDFLNATMVGN